MFPLFFRIFFTLFLFFLLSACSRSGKSFPGYIEGEYTYIASGIAGTLFNLAVQRGQTLEKGTLLYTLDPEPEKANVETSQANIKDLQAQVDFLKLQFDRQKNLYKKNATPKANVDQAQSDYLSKSEQLAANQAQLIQSQWSLGQKSIVAPVSGRVFDTFYRLGEKVEANHPVLALLAPENIKVQFYLPENVLSQIKLGQVITFSCDHCKGETTAHVSYISPEAEYTPPVIYSKDTRYKLVYLIRADMPKEIATQFHPGQPIEVHVK